MSNRIETIIGDIDFSDKTEGVEYINISKYSNTYLGKKLSIGYPNQFEMFFGRVGSVRNAIDFITTPGYPISVLSKKKLYPKDIKQIPTKKCNVVDKTPIAFYVLANRILSDKTLIGNLKELSVNFLTSFNIRETVIVGDTVKVVLPNQKMDYYLTALSVIIDMIKMNSFNVENIDLKAKELNNNKNIFTNTALNLSYS